MKLLIFITFFYIVSCKSASNPPVEISDIKTAGGEQVVDISLGHEETFSVTAANESVIVKGLPKAHALKIDFYGPGRENAQFTIDGRSFHSSSHGGTDFGFYFVNNESERPVNIRFNAVSVEVRLAIYKDSANESSASGRSSSAIYHFRGQYNAGSCGGFSEEAARKIFDDGARGWYLLVSDGVPKKEDRYSTSRRHCNDAYKHFYHENCRLGTLVCKNGIWNFDRE